MICFLGAVKIGSVESRLQRPLSDLMTPVRTVNRAATQRAK